MCRGFARCGWHSGADGVSNLLWYDAGEPDVKQQCLGVACYFYLQDSQTLKLWHLYTILILVTPCPRRAASLLILSQHNCSHKHLWNGNENTQSRATTEDSSHSPLETIFFFPDLITASHLLQSDFGVCETWTFSLSNGMETAVIKTGCAVYAFQDYAFSKAGRDMGIGFLYLYWAFNHCVNYSSAPPLWYVHVIKKEGLFIILYQPTTLSPHKIRCLSPFSTTVETWTPIGNRTICWSLLFPRISFAVWRTSGPDSENYIDTQFERTETNLCNRV